MHTIDRYIFQELIKIFVISVCALTLILYLDKILYLTELIINKGVTFIDVIRIMIYISPAFLALSIPMSVMVASVVTFSQFSAESELVAMKASGFGFLQLMKPVLLFSLLAYICASFIIFSALPWGNQSFKKMIFDILHNRATFEIKSNIFNEDFDNLVLFARERKSDVHLKKLFIADSTTSESPKIITAEEGTIVSDPEILKIKLKLKNGTIHDLSKKRRHYHILNFDRYDLTLNLPKFEKFQQRALKGNRELSLTELRNKIKKIKQEGKEPRQEQVELSKKFSIPFTCLAFGFIGAPLGVQSSRSGKSGSFAVSVAVILIYYIVLIATQNLGTMGALPPLISVWIPNIIALASGAYLVYKMHREIPFKIFNFIEDTLILGLEKLRLVYEGRFSVSTVSRGASLVVDKKQKRIDDTTKSILKAKLMDMRKERL